MLVLPARASSEAENFLSSRAGRRMAEEDGQSAVSTSASTPDSTAASELWCVLNPEVALLLIQWLQPAELGALATPDSLTADQLDIALLRLLCYFLQAWLAFFRSFSAGP